MKKILLLASFVVFCSLGSAMAQAPAATSVHTEKGEAAPTDAKKETKAASCCSKKSAAKSCSSESKSAGKSSCCQKAHHTDAKVEGAEEKKN